MVVIDENENVAAGTTTNGACYKIPGYVQLHMCSSCLNTQLTHMAERDISIIIT